MAPSVVGALDRAYAKVGAACVAFHAFVARDSGRELALGDDDLRDLSAVDRGVAGIEDELPVLEPRWIR